MFEKKRFEKVYTEGSSFGIRTTVLVDRETGVNYLFTVNGYAGGLSPLLDRDGKPVISRTSDIPEY